MTHFPTSVFFHLLYVFHRALQREGQKGNVLFHLKNAIAAACCSLAIGTSAMAQGTGSEGYFQIYNNTENNIVVGFYTNDGGGWSQNWLDDAVMPDQSTQASFNADTGACDQLFRVGWLSENDTEVLDEPISIDICAASNVFLDDNEIYYD